MTADLVYIIPYTVSFGSLQRGEIAPAEVYRRQISAWILQPVRALEQEEPSAPVHGMAAFTILLTFFEAHGQYVLGTGSKGQSKKCFCAGFKRFADSLSEESLGTKPHPDDMYQWTRCGLFHSATLADHLLVDTVNSGSGIFTRVKGVPATLVNPWRMEKHLGNYVERYCEEIMAQPSSKLADNFSRTFDRLVRSPMEHFCG